MPLGTLGTEGGGLQRKFLGPYWSHMGKVLQNAPKSVSVLRLLRIAGLRVPKHPGTAFGA